MELDDLKSAWKSVPNENTYNKNDIFEMMKKRSSSTIKWLFIFTLIEFILVLFFTTTTLLKYNKLSITNFSINDISSYYNYTIGSTITLIITIVFLILVYLNYKKININNSLTDLTNQIIKFRKTVNLFIITILISLIIVSIPYYYNLGTNLYLAKAGANFDPSKATIVGYISVLISILFLIIITALYYVIIHFLFLKKLSNNLKELNEIN